MKLQELLTETVETLSIEYCDDESTASALRVLAVRRAVPADKPSDDRFER